MVQQFRQRNRGGGGSADCRCFGSHGLSGLVFDPEISVNSQQQLSSRTVSPADQQLVFD